METEMSDLRASRRSEIINRRIRGEEDNADSQDGYDMRPINN